MIGHRDSIRSVDPTLVDVGGHLAAPLRPSNPGLRRLKGPGLEGLFSQFSMDTDTDSTFLPRPYERKFVGPPPCA